MINEKNVSEIIAKLTAKGIDFAPGLSETQIYRIESENNFHFPPDLRVFLMAGVPVSWSSHVPWKDELHIRRDFPNWHNDAKQIMKNARRYLLRGIYFDVFCNTFWMDDWGTKPDRIKAALSIAKRAVLEAPIMIPVYGHRFIPAEPRLPNNPVFSIVQTDIVYYGYDLMDRTIRKRLIQEVHKYP